MKTTPTNPGILWRGRAWRIAGAAIDAPTDPATQRIEANLRQYFGSEVRAIEGAAERRTAQKAALLRQDGQPKYVPAEHAERVSAIDAEFEAMATRITETAAAAVEATRQELLVLGHADPFDALTAAEQERAATRRPFIIEDVDGKPPRDLAGAIRSALAANDRAAVYLYGRYLPRRLAADGRTTAQELRELAHELRERLADPKLQEKRAAAERKLSAAQVLSGHVNMVRRGGVEGLMAEMRISGRYGG
jgi:hypothetical protein